MKKIEITNSANIIELNYNDLPNPYSKFSIVKSQIISMSLYPNYIQIELINSSIQTSFDRFENFTSNLELYEYLKSLF